MDRLSCSSNSIPLRPVVRSKPIKRSGSHCCNHRAGSGTKGTEGGHRPIRCPFHCFFSFSKSISVAASPGPTDIRCGTLFCDLFPHHISPLTTSSGGTRFGRYDFTDSGAFPWRDTKMHDVRPMLNRSPKPPCLETTSLVRHFNCQHKRRFNRDVQRYPFT